MVGFKVASEAKKNMPIILSLVGESSCGKTYSALRLAMGLTNGDPSKIFLIDSENRGAMYAWKFGDYRIASVSDWSAEKKRPTHRPDTYIEMIQAAKDAGCECLIIDSMSDVWEGRGGVYDWACELRDSKQAAGKRAGFDIWMQPKTKYAALMNFAINCGMSVIMTFRTKEVMELDENNKPKKERKIEIVREPRSNKYNIMWELMLDGQTKKLKSVEKCFDGGEWIFRLNEYLTEDVAQKMLQWQATDKEGLIAAAVRQTEDTKATWYKNLNDAEKYLITKYAEEIKTRTKLVRGEKKQTTEDDL